jgi:hypothetical protein
MALRSLYRCTGIFLLCLSSSLVSAPATGGATETSIAASFQQTLADGLKLQDETASAVATGKETPVAAISRLKSLHSVSGLKIADRNGEFAMAAIGVGQRLRGLKKATEALAFFAEAEKALVLVITKMPDSADQEKAMFLQNLAFIQGYYLGEAQQAKRAFDAAIKLQPKDEWLRSCRDGFLNAHAELTASDTNQSTK